MAAAAAIQNALGRLGELCLDEYSRETHRLQMIGSGTEHSFEVRIFCSGRPIADESAFSGSREGFDDLRLLAVPGGNIVCMSKTV